MAPRGHVRHRENEPNDPDALASQRIMDEKFDQLEKHQQPQKALCEDNNNEEESKQSLLNQKSKEDIPSFIYTSAHVRDL